MAGQGIIGDQFITDLPQTEVKQEDLAVEKAAAKFSRTKEFQNLKTYLEGRMEHYRTFLPDGRSVLDNTPTGEEWQIANAIIGEFNLVIQAYEGANEIVKNGREIS